MPSRPVDTDALCECGRRGATKSAYGIIIRGCPACEAADARFGLRRFGERRQLSEPRQCYADVRRACDAALTRRGLSASPIPPSPTTTPPPTTDELRP